jgi:DUF4097 and DUF4098 domain-containing protein YvlB
MPTYETPSAIDLAINLQVGMVELVASDRSDTVVTVVPTNPSKAVDRRGADETTTDFDGQRLTIVGPKPRLAWIGPTESVDIRVELPSGSRVAAEVAVGGVHSRGTLGATRVKASMGPVDLDTTGDLWMRAGHGNATAGTADGNLEITADHGQIRIGTVTGDALLKASHGNVQLDEAGGDVDAKLSYGGLEIGRALASVTARTAYGSVQLREISAGSVHVESGHGDVSIGVRTGTAAWLDLSSKEGRVRNQLDAESSPEPSEQTVAVRVHTQFGDISIRRAE